MKMEFIFNKDKIEKSSYTEDDFLNFIRAHFNKYNSKKTIREIEKGFFIGSDDDWTAFATTSKFPYYKDFLEVIQEWYWYIDEGDGLGEQKEDCLKSYYEVQEANK